MGKINDIWDEIGFVLPHHETFGSKWHTFSGTYPYKYDEALKHSAENALAARRDTFIMACLQERYLQVAQLPWHIEPENIADPMQQQIASALTQIIRAGDRWHNFTLQLCEAIWYGRYANEVKWGVKNIQGVPRMYVADHRPA